MWSAAAVRHASHRRWIEKGSEKVERHASQIMSDGSEKVLGHDSDKD
jgi:hypothetical protein